MRERAALSLLVGLLAVAGCGESEPATTAKTTGEAPAPATTTTAPGTTSTATAPAAASTTITVRDSEFGPMLFDGRRQAIYIFERDGEDESVCYDACAEAWPPVVTGGEPKAGDGVDSALLGTIERRDGTLQVTYAGQPLYFYAHEDPGQVLCHDVDLNGGLWWVVGPDGERRP